jgi:hypothetical protein
MNWKKGRGKLGVFQPLLGVWLAEADSNLGPLKCRREFKHILDGKFLQLSAHWQYASGSYDEIAIIGVKPEFHVCIWSFTSDGKQSQGQLADVTDIHPQAVGFEAQMPAGLARNIYWPDGNGGFYWAVESRTQKGWNRFVDHHYLPVNGS